jgi:uncharacterized phage infection (PIP) family protein YhgE
MSGGHFNYNQYRLTQIADDLQNAIDNNDIEDDWGYKYNYSKETLDKFRATVKELKELAIKVNRIDYLLSGDDGEESFHQRWNEELNK